MTTAFRSLLGFIGYGQPFRSVWFIGKEEHDSLIEDDSSWNVWIDEKTRTHSDRSYIIRGGEIPIRWNLTLKDNYVGYVRCSEVLRSAFELSRDRDPWSKGCFVNLYPIPKFFESEGTVWTEWLREKLGVPGWTREDYESKVLDMRSAILVRAIVEMQPLALVIFGDEENRFITKLFEEYRKGEAMFDNSTRQRYLPMIIGPYHPGVRLPPNLAPHGLTELDWINNIANLIRPHEAP